jgi:glycopeptide antibiotics resistance protein
MIERTVMRKNLTSPVFFLYLLAVVAATWWPFDFRVPAGPGIYVEDFRPTRLVQRWRVEKDMLKLALFIPVGIFLAMAWGAKGSSWKMLGRALVLGAGLSVLLQVGRYFLPGHFPSISDVVMNISGVLLGASVIYLHRFPRRILLMLLMACVLCFGLAATWPCRFSWQAATGTALTDRLEWSPFQGNFSMGVLRERALNGLIMLPLGLLAATYALRKDRLDRALLFTVLLGFGSSLSVELLQCFLPYRTPSISDLLLNTLGTLLGGVMAVGIERWSAVRHPDN